MFSRSCSGAQYVEVAEPYYGIHYEGTAAVEGPDFKGKTMTIIASFEAGGPYDFYSRLIARSIGAHLPGTGEDV